MEELIIATRLALGNTFAMYFKTQSYHWNVEGIMFSQYHDFFGDLYGDLYGAVDPLAEELRALDAYAPISVMDMYKYKTIEENAYNIVLIRDMLSSLERDNEELITTMNKVFDLASVQKQQGLANFAADRLDKHTKHGWQIRASLKNIG